MKLGCSYIFSIGVCYINSMQMKNIRDTCVHGQMNAKGNVRTNLIFFLSVFQVRYHRKCQLIADMPNRNSKVIPPSDSSRLIFSDSMRVREKSNSVLEAFAINFNLLNVFWEGPVTSETKLGVTSHTWRC